MSGYLLADMMQLALIWAKMRKIEPEEAIGELRELTILGTAHGIGRPPGMDWYPDLYVFGVDIHI